MKKINNGNRQSFRPLFLFLFFMIFLAAILTRLFWLQVLAYDEYRDLAENQHQLSEILNPVRGEILMHEGLGVNLVPAVTNIEKNIVFAEPQNIADPQRIASALAPILALPQKEILDKVSDRSRRWIVLKKEVLESESQKVVALNLDGIGLEPQTFRSYPEHTFASQLLGFLGFREDQRVGQYGVEEYFEQELAGKPGKLVLDKDAAGRWITGGFRELEPAQNGADAVLTIDRAIQFKTEEILKTAVEDHQADSGSVVIMSPKTGAVLALANYPSFDPNDFNKVEDPSVFRNSIVSDAYEPGSVFKAITMAAGLDSGAVTPDETYVDTGSVTLDKFTIRNAQDKVYGQQTMTQVLEQSINTGAIHVLQETGYDTFLEYLQKFGFGSATGIHLPSEVSGDISNLTDRGGDVYNATASFGQGITVTSLQLAQALSAIANQGRLVPARIVDRLVYPDGATKEFPPQPGAQVISSKTAATLGAMLVSVVEKGHGKRAAVPGYYIGGKTGTAQIARTDGRGYDPDKTIGTFIGFGPVEDPQFVIVVKIVNPKTVQFAESTAAPTFGQIAQYLVNYLRIPPTR
ncbi:MAG: hypothetical protein A3K06_02965 [Candidatus Doudnabacteria bacterium RIFCSPHIGHO2_01_52_17]|uniref:Penicillin-binding protein transpeptidase domain-containing protein n=1 Tax=Candidatus Doudnabacteria bacterium RIFCSPHIGHO2_01_52_17 TaxID=1817820 RepID=A0A1F5NBU4_9BACT|nr:MAG: Peptidoglycan glycosyltransferase [Parcubacteria group bacterium GW2011_GWA2_52_8]OGE75126.1 MAG: hypothetical protein A3K06_02965 [Candidatus Doudnabacteria bacterium RIFCSPHIGHO2_01_52_17]